MSETDFKRRRCQTLKIFQMISSTKSFFSGLIDYRSVDIRNYYLFSFIYIAYSWILITYSDLKPPEGQLTSCIQ